MGSGLLMDMISLICIGKEANEMQSQALAKDTRTYTKSLQTELRKLSTTPLYESSQRVVKSTACNIEIIIISTFPTVHLWGMGPMRSM